MRVLVTGGAGFIGSHTVVVLLAAGHEVIVADDLRNSDRSVLERVRQITGRTVDWYRADVADRSAVEALFAARRPEAVIHFAGLKAVAESVARPLDYYYNNTVSTMVLAGACLAHRVARFVFSSSATVYGENRVPFRETMPLRPAANPYGATKAFSERILADAARAWPAFCVALLRYFNPVGAHASGLIGEAPGGVPNNLMPYITAVAAGRLPKLRVFGDDYPTPDGTGVRDYIHVMDLAEGHLAALDRLAPGARAYNLGTGRGTSVRELVHAFEQVNGLRLPCETVARRPGDIAACYADASRAARELGWRAGRDIGAMCRDAWRFECRRQEREQAYRGDTEK